MPPHTLGYVGSCGPDGEATVLLSGRCAPMHALPRTLCPTHTYTHSLTLTHSLSLTHTLSLSLSHTHTLFALTGLPPGEPDREAREVRDRALSRALSLALSFSFSTWVGWGGGARRGGGGDGWEVRGGGGREARRKVLQVSTLQLNSTPKPKVGTP